MLSKLSLYSQYISECFGRHVIEDEKGFVAYDIKDDTCCIIDIFIIKEARRTGAFYKLCKQVHDIAKNHGCKKIVGFIHLENKTSHLSLKAQLSLGMKIVEANRDVTPESPLIYALFISKK